MAVRADNIALGCLSQHSIRAAIDHPRHRTELGRWIAVIEVHCALGKPDAAVSTWDRTQLIQEIRVIAPMRAPICEPRRRRRRTRGEPLTVARASPQPMTICADDIALCRLDQELLAILQRRSARAQPELLGRGIAMIEVHLMAGEAAATVGTRNVPKLPQELGRRGLAALDSR